MKTRSWMMLGILLTVVMKLSAATYFCGNEATRLGITYHCSPLLPTLTVGDNVMFVLRSEINQYVVQIPVIVGGTDFDRSEVSIGQPGMLPQSMKLIGGGITWLNIRGEKGLASATITLIVGPNISIDEYRITQVNLARSAKQKLKILSGIPQSITQSHRNLD